MLSAIERGYRFLPDAFQYSAGIAALPGHRLERISFAIPLPMVEGFAWIEAEAARRGLPLTTFAACELRSPEPLTPDGFVAFNRLYSARLKDWGIFIGEANPVARSNVCPVHHAPGEPVFHALTLAVPGEASRNQGFVISGGAETLAGKSAPSERIVAYRNRSSSGMAAKAARTKAVIAERLHAFGLNWSDCSAVQTYTAYELPAGFMDDLAQEDIGLSGMTLFSCRPPVLDVEFEMDCRNVTAEALVYT